MQTKSVSKKALLDLVAQSKGTRAVHFAECSRDFYNFDKDNPFDADSSIIPDCVRITLISVPRVSVHLHQGEIVKFVYDISRSERFQFLNGIRRT